MCRKGVLFFIRDPTERSYNPVKDILERPTMSQMRKVGRILKSGLMLTRSLAFQR
jgi:E3 ubiquitin-protein ligase DOA10